MTIARSEENAAKDPSPARLAGRIVMLGMAAAVGIGIARFAYSLILSDMRADLGWGYSQAGFLNTLNALGYLVGAIATPPVMARMGTMRSSGTSLMIHAPRGLRRDWRRPVSGFFMNLRRFHTSFPT